MIDEGSRWRFLKIKQTFVDGSELETLARLNLMANVGA